MVIRLENIGRENSSISPYLWVGLLAVWMCTGCLSCHCGFDPQCLGTVHTSQDAFLSGMG